MKVWNVIYTLKESDEFGEPTVRVRTFDSEEKAEKFLAKEFEETRKSYDGNLIFDAIEADNYGNNAEIRLGDSSDGETVEEIHVQHFWRVAMTTVNYTR